jgi:hypothetical protein
MEEMRNSYKISVGNSKYYGNFGGDEKKIGHIKVFELK